MPWPVGADGAGFSLVLISPNGNPEHNVATSWRQSASERGTPGIGPGIDLPLITGISNTADGIALELPVGTSFDIEFSLDLMRWAPIASGVTGIYEDTDAGRTKADAAYYRVVAK